MLKHYRKKNRLKSNLILNMLFNDLCNSGSYLAKPVAINISSRFSRKSEVFAFRNFLKMFPRYYITFNDGRV